MTHALAHAIRLAGRSVLTCLRAYVQRASARSPALRCVAATLIEHRLDTRTKLKHHRVRFLTYCRLTTGDYQSETETR